MNSCVSRIQLNRLLRLELCGPELEAVEAHVESCPSCQSILEELTAVDRQRLSETVDETLEPGLLDRLASRAASPGSLPVVPFDASGRPGVDPAAGVPATDTSRLPSLPGYRIHRELGRGGMGVVYLAFHERLNRPCAIKMIADAQFAGEEAVLRLLREAETVARLRQPGVVQIFHIGDHEGRAYLELEYLEGGTLAQQLDGTPWDSRRSADFVVQLARAIDAAHRAGVIHRDLKPGNILFTGDGTPKVADFGLARLTRAQTSLVARACSARPVTWPPSRPRVSRGR